MSPITIGNDTIVQEVTIKAPAARIFDALTRPSELLKWWKSAGKFQITHAECDVRPGGKWLMRVTGNCEPGSAAPESVVRGEYVVIEPPHLLTFTWIRELENQPETLVRWELDEKDGETTVRVIHSKLVTESLRARNSGWPIIVARLRAYIEHEA
jgi:uncharacterized protein YndB with AHSA1/START domain